MYAVCIAKQGLTFFSIVKLGFDVPCTNNYVILRRNLCLKTRQKDQGSGLRQSRRVVFSQKDIQPIVYKNTFTLVLRQTTSAKHNIMTKNPALETKMCRKVINSVINSRLTRISCNQTHSEPHYNYNKNAKNKFIVLPRACQVKQHS